MSKPISKVTIGAFVLGAIALVVAGIVIFGSGKFFTRLDRYVLYFTGSVKGLNIGAPVMFRGVKIGQVTDIQLRFDPLDLSVNIPVIIEVDPERFRSVSGREMNRDARRTEQLIERGLKAQLQLQSFVTGMLMVDIDFYPDEPTRLVAEGDIQYPEIPTIPSGLQKLTRTLEQLPVDELFHKLVKTVEGIEEFVNSPDLQGSVASLKKALDSAERLFRDVDKEIEPLVASIDSTLESARGAFDQAEKTLAMEEGVPGEFAADARETLATARDTLASASDALKQAKHTLKTYEGVVAEDSDVIYEVNAAMRELSAAARAIRYFVDYIDRHPEALLRGKKQ